MDLLLPKCLETDLWCALRLKLTTCRQKWTTVQKKTSSSQTEELHSSLQCANWSPLFSLSFVVLQSSQHRTILCQLWWTTLLWESSLRLITCTLILWKWSPLWPSKALRIGSPTRFTTKITCQWKSENGGMHAQCFSTNY